MQYNSILFKEYYEKHGLSHDILWRAVEYDLIDWKYGNKKKLYIIENYRSIMFLKRIKTPDDALKLRLRGYFFQHTWKLRKLEKITIDEAKKVLSYRHGSSLIKAIQDGFITLVPPKYKMQGNNCRRVGALCYYRHKWVLVDDTFMEFGRFGGGIKSETPEQCGEKALLISL